jgi:DNA-binding Lrp family transcriptional regulator
VILLDETDRRLVGALHLAPRASWDDLATILSADPSTLRRRYDRLQEDRVIRVIGEVGWGLHSTAMPVHVFLDIAGHPPLSVLDRLREIPHMQYLGQISGSYPIYAVVHAPSERATSEVLDRIFATPGVRRVTALPALSTLRRATFWDPQFLTPAERERCLALAGTAITATRDVATTAAPAKPLSDAERAVVSMLLQDGRASAASLGRAAGLPTSTAHRLVRRLLTEGWVKPRVEIESERLGFATTFLLRLRARPGTTPAVLSALDRLPQIRLAAHVAGEASVLAMGLVTDRAALAAFLDDQLAGIADVDVVGVDVVLAERRRYWLDRDPDTGLGRFTPPSLL